MVSQIGGTIKTRGGPTAKPPATYKFNTEKPHKLKDGNSNPVGNAETDLIRILTPRAPLDISDAQHDHNIIAANYDAATGDPLKHKIEFPSGVVVAIDAGSAINRFLRGKRNVDGGGNTIEKKNLYQDNFQALTQPKKQEAINAINNICRLRYTTSTYFDDHQGHKNVLEDFRAVRDWMESSSHLTPNDLHLLTAKDMQHATNERSGLYGKLVAASASASGGSRRKRRVKSKKRRKRKSRKRKSRKRKSRKRK